MCVCARALFVCACERDEMNTTYCRLRTPWGKTKQKEEEWRTGGGEDGRRGGREEGRRGGGDDTDKMKRWASDHTTQERKRGNAEGENGRYNTSAYTHTHTYPHAYMHVDSWIDR